MVRFQLQRLKCQKRALKLMNTLALHRAESAGPSVVFGVEAAVVAGLFLVIVPLLQWKGAALRNRFPREERAI